MQAFLAHLHERGMDSRLNLTASQVLSYEDSPPCMSLDTVTLAAGPAILHLLASAGISTTETVCAVQALQQQGQQSTLHMHETSSLYATPSR